MTIELRKCRQKRSVYYEADMKDLSGSPWVGRGRTKREAIGDLLFGLAAGIRVGQYRSLDIAIVDGPEQDYTT